MFHPTKRSNVKHVISREQSQVPLVFQEFFVAQNKAFRANQDLVNTMTMGIQELVQMAETNTELRACIIDNVQHRLQVSAAQWYSTLPLLRPANTATAPPATGTWQMQPKEVTDVCKNNKATVSSPTTFMLCGVPFSWDLGRLRQELSSRGLVESRDVDCICLVTAGKRRHDSKVSNKEVAVPKSQKQNKGYAFVNVTLPEKGDFLQKAFVDDTLALTVRVAKNQGMEFYRKHHGRDSVFFHNCQGGNTNAANPPLLSTLLNLSSPEEQTHLTALSAGDGDSTGPASESPTKLEVLQALQRDDDGTTCQVPSEAMNRTDLLPQPDENNLIATALLAYLQECDA